MADKPTKNTQSDAVYDGKSGQAYGDDKAIVMAAIAGAHGVRGAVRLKLFCDGLPALKRYQQFNNGALTLTQAHNHKTGAIAHFAEITDRNKAEQMRGTTLSVARSQLPALAEDEYYHIDVIGKAVFNEQGEAIGHVHNIENFGAGDLLDIKPQSGKRFYIPMHATEPKDDGYTIANDWLDQ